MHLILFTIEYPDASQSAGVWHLEWSLKLKIIELKLIIFLQNEIEPLDESAALRLTRKVAELVGPAQPVFGATIEQVTAVWQGPLFAHNHWAIDD